MSWRTININYTPVGHSNNSVVHMCDQRNMKKGLFFEAGRDSRLGVKMCLFLRKSVLLDSIKGAFRGHFSNSTEHVLQKACLGVNLG